VGHLIELIDYAFNDESAPEGVDSMHDLKELVTLCMVFQKRQSVAFAGLSGAVGERGQFRHRFS
jgi:hypothetical protein